MQFSSARQLYSFFALLNSLALEPFKPSRRQAERLHKVGNLQKDKSLTETGLRQDFK